MTKDRALQGMAADARFSGRRTRESQNYVRFASQLKTKQTEKFIRSILIMGRR